ncbi:MAG: amidohydrolase family protein [Chloroflexi bacterium]|nr:amidohydrolase family protein [Chloroflexota bacterium]
MLILANATVITGDGQTVIQGGTVVVDGARIVDVRAGSLSGGPGDQTMDLGGRLLIPGAISTHAHGGVAGPAFASGSPALSMERVLANLDTHLRHGTTTVLNLDGFNLPAEVDATAALHPIHLRTGTIHFPLSFQAARLVDGTGLTPAHEAMTVGQMLAYGAPAIGEVGAGQTLGGGGADYMFIPAAVERETGVRLEPRQSAALKYACLGRRVRVEEFDRAGLEAALARVGLAGKLAPERAREIIHKCVLSSFQTALDGVVESARLAVQHGVPATIHTSAPSEEVAYAAADICGSLLISGHTNHSTFTVAESIICARRLREKGAWIEACTLDAFGLKRLVATPEHLYALLREDLVDFVSTDYAAGNWDEIYVGLAHAVADGAVSLARAVALATKKVTVAIPKLAPDRGEIAPGQFADLAVCRDRLDQVELVFVDGELVCEDGTVRRKTATTPASRSGARDREPSRPG